MSQGEDAYIGVGQDSVVTSFFRKLYHCRPGEQDKSKHGTR